MRKLQEYQNLSVIEIVRNFNEIKEKLKVKGFEFKDGQPEKILSAEFFEHSNIVNISDLFLILSKHDIEQILAKIDQDLLVFALFSNVDLFINETVIDILTSKNFNCSYPKLLVSMIDNYIYEDRLYVVSNAEMKRQKETLVKLREQFNKKNQELLIGNKLSNQSNLTEEFIRNVLVIKRLHRLLIEHLGAVCLRNGAVTISDLVDEFKEALTKEKRLLSSYERLLSDKNVKICNASDVIEQVLISDRNNIEKVLSEMINHAFLDGGKCKKYALLILSKAISPKSMQVDDSEKLINLFDLDIIVEFDVNDLEILSSSEALSVLKSFEKQIAKSGNLDEFNKRFIEFVQHCSRSFFDDQVFKLMIAEPKWLDLFIDYNFESVYEFIEKQVSQCRAYHFGALFRDLKNKQKTGKALTLFDMFVSPSDQVKIVRSLPVMFNFYIVSERLKSRPEYAYKLAQLNDVFKQADNIYFSIFEDKLPSFISDIFDLWIEKKNLNIENLNDVKLAINDSHLIKRLAKQIANETDDYKIDAEHLTSAIGDSLMYDFDKILKSSNNVVYYDILDKMKFLGMNNEDLIANQSIADDQKTVFILRQLLNYFIDDNIAETLQKKNSKELCEINFTPVFNDQVISRIRDMASLEFEDDVTNSFINKACPVHFKLTLVDFVKFIIFLKENTIFSKISLDNENKKMKIAEEYRTIREREKVEDLLISLFSNAVKNQKIGIREFLEKNSEYNIPIFYKLNKKYIFLKED